MAGKFVTEIINSLKEYTKDDITDIEAAKSEILQMLKTYRPIKIVDYYCGLSHALKENHRLIVKEENDKTKVREYQKRHSKWYCLNSASSNQNCNSHPVKIQFGIIFAPKNHSEKCKTKEYSKVMEIQELLNQGKTHEARILVQSRKSVSKKKKLTNQFLSTSILNESNLPTMDMENNPILNHSVTDERTAVINITSLNSQTPTPASTENVLESTRSSVKRELNNSDDCIFIEEISAKRLKIELNNIETFSFLHPSSLILEKICKKLKTEYSNLAYKFWANIEFHKILSVSKNIKIHSFKSQNIFACFSLFFTGKIDSCFRFQDIINSAFRDDLNNAGEMASVEIDEIFSSNTVTDQHLEFICKFLSCRIGIYENGNLKKFGKWETENVDALTLILSVGNGFYSVVLNV